MTFRDRLLGTLAALRPVLEEPGVLIVGSEVPNLLQPDAILFVDEARLLHVASRRHIRVGLGPDFLTATAVALVPFDSRGS